MTVQSNRSRLKASLRGEKGAPNEKLRRGEVEVIWRKGNWSKRVNFEAKPRQLVGGGQRGQKAGPNPSLFQPGCTLQNMICWCGGGISGQLVWPGWPQLVQIWQHITNTDWSFRPRQGWPQAQFRCKSFVRIKNQATIKCWSLFLPDYICHGSLW